MNSGRLDASSTESNVAVADENRSARGEDEWRDPNASPAVASTLRRVSMDESATSSTRSAAASGTAAISTAEVAATGRGGHRSPRDGKTTRDGRPRREVVVDVMIRALFLLFLMALWQGLHYLMVTRPGDASRGALFPSPVQTFEWLWNGFGFSWFSGSYVPPPGAPMPQSFWGVLQQADYPAGILLSVWRLLQGYAIAVAIGFPLGLLVARFSLAEKTIGWMASSLQSLPSVCWTPLALLWFGFISVQAPILFVTVMGALFSTVVSVSDGIANVPPLMSRAGRTLGAHGPRLYFSILLPAALPGIVSGLKVGWAFAWRSLMAAEIIVNSGGLGFLLQRDRDQSDAEGVVTTIIVIILIGLSVQSLVFGPIERRLQNLWGLNQKS